MPQYTITESVGNRVERVRSFEDLEKHHPSSGREPGRSYATINGELEEVRLQGGRTYVKKDFILSQDTPGPVFVPAPVSGYVHYLNDSTNAIRIYDRPFGTPGAVMMAQSLHMKRGTSPPQGAYIQYGAPLGRMGDTGSPGSVHAHIELEVAQFKRYIGDMVDGTIQPGAVDPMVDGVLRQGEQGASVHELQRDLSRVGLRDAQGGLIEADGQFGRRTMEAVQAFQRSLGWEPDGIAGRDVLSAVRQAADLSASERPQTATPISPPGRSGLTPPHSTGDDVSTSLSNLIGSGEGSYNSYNRGRAGDTGGREIDFSQMTVGEVMRRQALPRSNPESLFAVGKFQMIPGTLRETVDALGVDVNARFTPHLQERMFADYLIGGKRPAINTYITGRSESAQGLQRAQLALAQEFASVADPRTGRSHYEGDSAGNSSSITAEEAGRALDAMRQQYQANIARGLTPEAAYRALSGAAPTQDPLADGVLRQGERGDAVRALQAQLNRLGARDAQGRALDADGEFGRRTAEAVVAFQRSRDLEPDGIAGRDTLGALRTTPRPAINALPPEGAVCAAAKFVKQREQVGIERGAETCPAAAHAGLEGAETPDFFSKAVRPGSNSHMDEAALGLSDEPRSHANSTTSFVDRLLEAARRHDAGAIDDATRGLLASQTGRDWQDEGQHRLLADSHQLAQTPSRDPSVDDMSR